MASEINYEHIYTAIFDVKGSYPAPPEAKLTPVRRSLGCKVGSLDAGRSSLIPNSSTDKKKIKKKKNWINVWRDYFY
jgi:hypothetical protein